MGDWITHYTYAVFDGETLELTAWGAGISYAGKEKTKCRKYCHCGDHQRPARRGTVERIPRRIGFSSLDCRGEGHSTVHQKISLPNPKTFIGSGKLEEVQAFVEANDVSTVVFDDELTPAQQNNIEKTLRCKILDRTGLILDIFAQRAQTSYARTQVELAQYQYLLPRLKGLWTHLERQKGGIGMRGPGETEIETDRRIVRDKNYLIKEETHRYRQANGNPKRKVNSLSALRYTNVGKSTLMNVLSKSVQAENKLLATLDTTVRKVVIGNILPPLYAVVR